MIVALLYTPYMLHMMGQNEFGLYSLVSSMIAYLTVLDLGFGNAIIRYTAKFRSEGKIKEQQEMFGMFLKLYTIIGIISFALGLVLYYNVGNIFGETMSSYEIERAKIMILILIFNLAVTFPFSIFGSIMSAYERFVFPKVMNIIRIILNTAIMVVLLHYGFKALALVIVQTIFNLLTLFINYFYCKYYLKIHIKFGKVQWQLLKEVSIYSFWIFLSAIIDRIYWSTGQFVLGAISGTIAVSIFAVAIQLQSMYMQFSVAISSVFLPKVTGMVAKGDNKNELSDLFIRTGRVQNILMSTILFGFMAFGRPFIKLWAGEEYSDAYIMTLLFFVSLYTPLIQNMGLTILQARNQMKFRSLSYIVIALIALGLEIWFTRIFGSIGCAIAISLALIIGQGLIMNIYYYKTQSINIPLFWREIIKMDMFPFFFSLVSYFVTSRIVVNSWFTFIICIVVYCAILLPLIFVTCLNNYEKDLILSIIKQKNDRRKK